MIIQVGNPGAAHALLGFGSIIYPVEPYTTEEEHVETNTKTSLGILLHRAHVVCVLGLLLLGFIYGSILYYAPRLLQWICNLSRKATRHIRTVGGKGKTHETGTKHSHLRLAFAVQPQGRYHKDVRIPKSEPISCSCDHHSCEACVHRTEI